MSSFELNRNGWGHIIDDNGNNTTLRTMGKGTVANEYSPVNATGGYGIESQEVLFWPTLEAGDDACGQAEKQPPAQNNGKTRRGNYIQDDMCG